MREVVTGIDFANRYDIVDKNDAIVLMANERSDCCERYCLGKARGYQMDFQDHNGEVMHGGSEKPRIGT